jgi:putative tricarboxylic transport membrane protein
MTRSATAVRLKRNLAIGCWLLLLGLGLPTLAAAPAWKPAQNIEIVVPAAAGGANDLTGRLTQRTLQESKLVDYPIAVVNKPGGGHTIGLNYLNQRAGDGHFLMVETIDLLTNRITGKTSVTHKEITPIAVLYGDYITLSVNAGSALKTCADFLARLKQDPSSLSIALSSSLGNANHLGVALLAKKAGVDIKRMKIVVYNSGAETIAALLGGHVDAVARARRAVLALYRGRQDPRAGRQFRAAAGRSSRRGADVPRARIRRSHLELAQPDWAERAERRAARLLGRHSRAHGADRRVEKRGREKPVAADQSAEWRCREILRRAIQPVVGSAGRARARKIDAREAPGGLTGIARGFRSGGPWLTPDPARSGRNNRLRRGWSCDA